MSGITNNNTPPTANTNRDATELAQQKSARAVAFYQNNLELADPLQLQINRPQQLGSSSARSGLLYGRTTQLSLTLQQQLATLDPSQFRITSNPRVYPPPIQYDFGAFVASVGGVSLAAIQINSTEYYYQFTSTASSGTIVCTKGVTCDILVIGGGGSGGAQVGGGGGAGGVVYQRGVPLNPGTYTIAVGAGGTAAPQGPPYVAGNDGSPSSISLSGSTLIVNGITYRGNGGGGGGANQGVIPGRSGGSGGGGSTNGDGTSTIGGSASQGTTYFNGTTTVAGGYAGSDSVGGGNFMGGGGGGAGGAFASAQGNGGTGVQLSITGTPTFYAAGGGGGRINPSAGFVGGSGIGGDGAYNVNAPNTLVRPAKMFGTNGTGSGGGGGAYDYSYDKGQNGSGGGAGGSGVVIIRFRYPQL